MKNIKRKLINSANNNQLDETWELARLLSNTRDAIRKVRQKELDTSSISGRRAAVMYNIHDLGDKATPISIAERLLRKRHTLSELLTKMEKDGLVKKIYDLQKKGMVRVVLTDKGISILQKTYRRESIHRIMAVLSVQELVQLEKYLMKLRDAIIKNRKNIQTKYLSSADDKLFELFGLLIQVTELIQNSRREELSTYGFELSHSAIMLCIQNLGDKATLSSISRQLIREPHTISEILTIMESKGEIIKIKDLNNRHTLRVQLTEKGRRIYQNIIAGTSYAKILTVLSNNERLNFANCLQKLLAKAMCDLQNDLDY